METYLSSTLKQFGYYKSLGEKTFEQLTFEELQKEFNNGSNSIAIIVKHLAGNMLSRWTNLLTEDGEKPWRQRDHEFVDSFTSKDDLLQTWNKGWDCLFNAIESLTESDLNHIIYIRNEGHTVTEAINRQMMHYAYHTGQIVLLGKQLKGSSWQSLSIPKGKSKQYNANKFSQNKKQQHFTDEV
jgi:uncharacterized damage-inducible protein DinB